MLLEQAGPRARKGLPPVDSTRTVAGRTCFEWAQQRGHDEVAALLERDLIAQLGDGWKEQVLLRDSEATAAAAASRRVQVLFCLTFCFAFHRAFWLSFGSNWQDATLAALAAEVAEEEEAEAAADEAALERLVVPEPEPALESESENEYDDLDAEEEVRHVSAPGPWADPRSWSDRSRVSPTAWASDEAPSPGALDRSDDSITRVQVLGKFGRKLHSIRTRHAVRFEAHSRLDSD